MKLILGLAFFISASFSYGEEYKPKPFKPEAYKQDSYKPDPYVPKKPPHNWDTNLYKPADKNYKYNPGGPRQLKEAELKDFVFSIPRKGITINNFDFNQTTFSLKGNYKSEDSLNNFLKDLKRPIRSKKGLDLKTKTTSFAGAKTFHYEVTAENQF